MTEPNKMHVMPPNQRQHGFADKPPPIRLAGVVWLACLAAAFGQQEAEQPANTPKPPPASGVYVDDSFEAQSLLTKADRQAARGRWTSAANDMAQIVRLHGRKLLAHESNVYLSAAEVVARTVADWPEEGLTAYRSVCEAEAAEKLEDAGASRNLHDLSAVFRDYFCTCTALEAADAIADTALEAGVFYMAVDTYRQLLLFHPDRNKVYPHVASRLAICLAAAGKQEEARALAREVVQKQPAQTVRLMGNLEDVTAAVEIVLSQRRSPAPAKASLDWPVVFGNTARNRVVETPPAPTAPLWRFVNFSPSTLPTDPEETAKQSYLTEREEGRLLGFFPVVWRGVLYFHDARRVWAVQAAGGTKLWEYAHPQAAMLRRMSSESGNPIFFAAAADGDHVYARLGGYSPPYYGYRSTTNSSIVVCLDAADGREVWRTGRERLGKPFDATHFDSTPICKDSHVYVPARRHKLFGFEDCYLMCFDAGTGELAWKTHLGSASIGDFGYQHPTLSIPALADGTVYVNTNLGTIAAVNAYDGSVRWLRVYPRAPEIVRRDHRHRLPVARAPWHYDPVIVLEGKLVIRPLDAGGIFVVDRDDGRIVTTLANQEGDDLEITSVLGVIDESLYAMGDDVFCWNLSSGELQWRLPLDMENHPYGRAVLTSHHVYVPTRRGLLTISLADRQTSFLAWAGDGDGGNLLILPDRLIVAGNDHIAAYADRDEVFARLRSRMTEAPHDPDPALDLAEIAFRSGELTAGLQAFEDAISRAGGLSQVTNAKLKARIFHDCMSFAKTFLSMQPPQLNNALRLYEVASQCPPDTADHLRYRLRMATLYLELDRPVDALELWQQILADPSLRLTTYPDREHEGRTAGDVIVEAIGNLIAQRGRDIYAPFERRAEEWLRAGRESKDVALLRKVVDSYPNSLAAPQALVSLGRLYDSQARPGKAARAYFDAYTRYPNHVQGAETIAALARAHLAAGDQQAAARWLNYGANAFPEERIEHDNRQVTLEQLRDTLCSNVRIPPTLPSLHPPLDRRYERHFDHPFTVLSPRLVGVSSTDWDTIVVHGAEQLQAYRTDGTARWADPIDFPHQPELLATIDDRLLLTTRYAIKAISPADPVAPDVTWQYGLDPARIDDPAFDPEWLPAMIGYLLSSDRLLCFWDNGKAGCISTSDGTVLWEKSLLGSVREPYAMNSRLIAYRSSRDGSAAINVLDTNDGTLLHQIELNTDSQVLKLILTPEDLLLVATTQSLQAFDAADGTILWSRNADGIIYESTLQAGLDGIYFSDDGLRLKKLSLGDSRTLWTAEIAAWSAADETDGIQCTLHDSILYVTSERWVGAHDAIDGRLLWQASADHGWRWKHRQLTDRFLVAIGWSIDADDETRHYTAYFFDRHDRSGLTAKPVKQIELGDFHHVRNCLIRNNAILIQAEDALYGWSAGARRP